MAGLGRGGDRDSSAGTSDYSSPFTRPRFVVSAVLLLSVIITGVALTWDIRRQPRPSSAQSANDGSNPAIPVAVNTELTQPCPPLPPGDQSLPHAAPPGITWEFFRDVLAMPSSPTAGPSRNVGSVASCFADTPTGALIAAAQISSRLFLATDGDSVAQYQVMPGPGQDSYREQHAELGGGPAVPDAQSLRQFAGFRFVTYTQAQAVIELVRREPTDGSLTVAVDTVVWDAGDWKLQLQDDGSESAVARHVADLSEYVKWGPA